MVPTSPGESWNFVEILENSRNFLWSNSPKERFLSKHQHFSGFLCMTNCRDFHLRYNGCNNVYIFSANHWSSVDIVLRLSGQFLFLFFYERYCKHLKHKQKYLSNFHQKHLK